MPHMHLILAMPIRPRHDLKYYRACIVGKSVTERLLLTRRGRKVKAI